MIELLVVVIAIGILAGFALDRLLPLIGKAEKVKFLEVQGDLATALVLETAVRMTRGESATVPSMAGSNPMDYLLKPPENYLGSLEEPRHEAIPSGSWYFDKSRGRLIYRVGSHTLFEAREGPPERIEFQVRLAYADRDGDGVFNPSADRFDGVWLKSVHAYEWPDTETDYVK